ncbi:hypothetical protein MJO29_006344 [Puccinia striiformis f. sp. tritici]|nr:hypothetical protein MJO29_006344 [Puccinia striiformis f. sp. tritici]KAI9605142.1 hypothetical protein H4Q26_003116 [Puccinia striiformis f. sp. tritici PST-130]KAI9609224.1 hypothetical protein KEM48_002931 [Puccinia striiformis f. sp. tritici PST-130]POW09484.1 hypothetical protein PSHT_09117 [Puccinia striiformis]POW12440.1 hypothetical protein PSTT_04504 [Puccinia striiformis]
MACGLAIKQIDSAPIFILRPFPANIGIYYPLQYFYGTALRDFGEHVRPNELEAFIDRMDPALNLEKNVHHPMYGGKSPGGFTAVDRALDQDEPDLAGPAHQTLKRLREETRSQGKEIAS